MQVPREARRIYNIYRSRKASDDRRKGRHPNGGWGWLDDYRLERIVATSKRGPRAIKRLRGAPCHTSP